EWQERVKRRVTIEYTMLDGVNDAPWQAKALGELLRGMRAHVNLIPFNPWRGSGVSQTPTARLESFKAAVEASGLSVSVRFSRGRDAGGACGQLALRGGQVATAPAPA